MGTTLHTLAPNPGATHKKKRVGRGPGSGYGKTAGRGQKGQKARAGHHGARVGFEGGQMPMQRRLPKRGFKNPFRVEAHPVNLGDLAKRFSDGDTVDVETLRNVGIVPKKAMIIKILAEGELDKKLTVRAHRFSKKAMAKLEAAGGAAEVIGKGVEKPEESAKQETPAAE
jgi:large subunit ribosomal protein L15